MEIDRDPREVARRMIIDGISLKKVARMTGLSQEALQEIAAECHCAPNFQQARLSHPGTL